MLKVKIPATCVGIVALATSWCQAEKGSIASYKHQEWSSSREDGSWVVAGMLGCTAQVHPSPGWRQHRSMPSAILELPTRGFNRWTARLSNGHTESIKRRVDSIDTRVESITDHVRILYETVEALTTGRR